MRVGDTLYSIARQFGTTVDAIMAANRLNSTRIWVGEQLIILPPGQAVTPYPPVSTYVVQPGDTLYSLARRYGTTVQAIARANGLHSPNIYVGQRLRIPSP